MGRDLVGGGRQVRALIRPIIEGSPSSLTYGATRRVNERPSWHRAIEQARSCNSSSTAFRFEVRLTDRACRPAPEANSSRLFLSLDALSSRASCRCWNIRALNCEC